MQLGYPQEVNPPTFCAANEIVSLVLSKTSFSGIPLTLEISTTNIFGQTIVVEINLALMSFDSSPTRGKTLNPSNLKIIDGYSFEYMSSAWASLSMLSHFFALSFLDVCVCVCIYVCAHV